MQRKLDILFTLHYSTYLLWTIIFLNNLLNDRFMYYYYFLNTIHDLLYLVNTCDVWYWHIKNCAIFSLPFPFLFLSMNDCTRTSLRFLLSFELDIPCKICCLVGCLLALCTAQNSCHLWKLWTQYNTCLIFLFLHFFPSCVATMAARCLTKRILGRMKLY